MISEALHRRYLHDVVFHTLVQQILCAIRSDKHAYSFEDIRNAVDVAEVIEITRSRRSVFDLDDPSLNGPGTEG